MGIGSAAAQNASIPIGKNGDVELTDPTSVGTTALKPGHYRFKHVAQNGVEYLVVSQQHTERRGSQHYATGARTEVARVVCQVVPLDVKSQIPRRTRAHNRMDPAWLPRSAFGARASVVLPDGIPVVAHADTPATAVAALVAALRTPC